MTVAKFNKSSELKLGNLYPLFVFEYSYFLMMPSHQSEELNSLSLNEMLRVELILFFDFFRDIVLLRSIIVLYSILILYLRFYEFCETEIKKL